MNMNIQTRIIKRDPSRRIPLQPDWFDYHLDSIVYSFMLVSATARIKPGDILDGTKSYLYLSQSKYTKIRPMMRQITGKTARQINERVQKLIQSGYVAYDSEAREYTFPYDYNEKYYIVSTSVLAYLCTVTNPFVIKIYFYLADKFNYKHDYLFNLTQIRKALGYTGSANARANDLIKVALSALSMMKFISYEQVQVQGIGTTNRVVDSYQLINVIGRKLPLEIEQQLENNLSLQSKNIAQTLIG